MLEYFALGLLIFVVLVIFYGVIIIHDIPYEIARKRKHPHQDAIHVAGWVSLLTLHILWPFLWIWATIYRSDRGWGFNTHGMERSHEENSLIEVVENLQARVEKLEKQNKI
ncbi:DUF3302 domain-containing protein [Enterobacter kobei]